MSINPQPTASAWRVIGLGTRMSGDDEIGLLLVETLAREPNFASCCLSMENADMATIALDLMERGTPAILVDAADMGLSPGASRLLEEHEARACLRSDAISIHGLGLPEGLAIARALGFEAPVKLFAVQPFDIAPRAGLTTEMHSHFGAIFGHLRETFPINGHE